jgi:hypothetical protein
MEVRAAGAAVERPQVDAPVDLAKLTRHGNANGHELIGSH